MKQDATHSMYQPDQRAPQTTRPRSVKIERHIRPLCEQCGRRVCPHQDADAPPHLSNRQVDVARCVAAGLHNAQIATVLRLSEGSAKQYVTRTLAALGLTSRLELAIWVEYHREWIQDRAKRNVRKPAAPKPARYAAFPELLAAGLSDKEIAAATGLSVATVKGYMNRLHRATGLKTRIEVALHAIAKTFPDLSTRQ